MTTPLVNTLALVPPNRPTEADFGGTAKEDDAVYPPNPVTMATAADWNEKVRMMAAAWRLLPVAVIPVTIVAGAPTIGTPQCGNDALTGASFTPVDNGPGDTTISWAANTFPAATIPPIAVNNATSGFWLAPLAIAGANSVQVQTANAASALADADFTVFIF